MREFDVAIVGSGFAGSVLARCLARQGKRVLLLERDRHPRFAIGESSTPLAAIALERLAARYGMGDLDRLAAYGRWMESYPEVRRGLKRGFSFYPHQAGMPLLPEPASRLLVAASPNDDVSDSHWMRSDVDAFLVDRAVEDGVEFRDRCEVTGASEDDLGISLTGLGEEGSFDVRAAFAVDASGAAAAVARHLGASRVPVPARFQSSVIFSHFSGVLPLSRIWQQDGLLAETGPYPDDRAAVHHLVDEGWVYVLPFDHDCVSAGLVADGSHEQAEGEQLWQAVLDKYPTLGRQFRDARTLRPLTVVDPLQYRLSAATGRRWAALPHVFSFMDPMFSTGIAWSLLGVERLADVLGREGERWREGLAEYGRRLASEAAQVESLIYGAHLARPDFAVYAAHTQLYFALVSFEEVRQRIFDGPEGAISERRFLGGGEEWAEGVLGEAVARLEGWSSGGQTEASAAEYVRWVADVIAPRNIAGLADPERRNLYPVNMDLLVERAGLIGLTAAEMIPLLPRLRGQRQPATQAD
jgi:FADH2 O2-dependent halogenase